MAWSGASATSRRTVGTRCGPSSRSGRTGAGAACGVWPGEAVRIAIDFSHGFEGEPLYLFHCHILEHEDSGMMVNVKVVEP